MAVLFLHGAGGFIEDRPLLEALRAGLDVEVLAPNLDEGIETTHQAWSRRIVEHLRPDVDVVVGHSFGGSTVLRLLAERDLGIRRLILLAAPDWGPHGWDVPEFALPDDAAGRLPEGLEVELHHCLDDEVVPIDHMYQLAARLPAARVVYRRDGGHQFLAPASDAVVRRLLGPRAVDDDGPFFHGTRAPLAAGEELHPGRDSNYGERRRANFIYLTASIDPAVWAAELAHGDGPPRLYEVQPSGVLEDDPNLTDQVFAGNPTRSYRTTGPLRVVREITDWEPHPPEAVQQMRDGVAELARRGIEAIND